MESSVEKSAAVLAKLSKADWASKCWGRLPEKQCGVCNWCLSQRASIRFGIGDRDVGEVEETGAGGSAPKPTGLACEHCGKGGFASEDARAKHVSAACTKVPKACPGCGDLFPPGWQEGGFARHRKECAGAAAGTTARAGAEGAGAEGDTTAQTKAEKTEAHGIVDLKECPACSESFPPGWGKGGFARHRLSCLGPFRSLQAKAGTAGEQVPSNGAVAADGVPVAGATKRGRGRPKKASGRVGAEGASTAGAAVKLGDLPQAQKGPGGSTRCGHCAKRFASEEDLVSHTDAGCPKAPKQCPGCGNYFPPGWRDGQYARHKKTCQLSPKSAPKTGRKRKRGPSSREGMPSGSTSMSGLGNGKSPRHSLGRTHAFVQGLKVKGGAKMEKEFPTLPPKKRSRPSRKSTPIKAKPTANATTSARATTSAKADVAMQVQQVVALEKVLQRVTALEKSVAALVRHLQA